MMNHHEMKIGPAQTFWICLLAGMASVILLVIFVLAVCIAGIMLHDGRPLDPVAVLLYPPIAGLIGGTFLSLGVFLLAHIFLAGCAAREVQMQASARLSTMLTALPVCAGLIWVQWQLWPGRPWFAAPSTDIRFPGSDLQEVILLTILFLPAPIGCWWLLRKLGMPASGATEHARR